MTSLNDDHPGDIAHSSKSSMNGWAAVSARVPVPSQMLGGPESMTPPSLPPASLPPPPLLPLLPLVPLVPLPPVPPLLLAELPTPPLLPATEPLLLPVPLPLLPVAMDEGAFPEQAMQQQTTQPIISAASAPEDRRDVSIARSLLGIRFSSSIASNESCS
jgi:hypothetical protein